MFHDAGGVYAGTDEPYLFGRLRVSGPDPEHRSYRSFASFQRSRRQRLAVSGDHHAAARPRRRRRHDVRVGERFASALRRAAAAHGEHEKRIGKPTRTGRTGTPST